MSKEKKKIREKFAEEVFARDNWACKVCENSLHDMFTLDAHHITDRNEMPNGGYVKENGITLCSECHIKAEVFHVSYGERWADGFHPDDLYKLIGSNKNLAIKESKKL